MQCDIWGVLFHSWLQAGLHVIDFDRSFHLSAPRTSLCPLFAKCYISIRKIIPWKQSPIHCEAKSFRFRSPRVLVEWWTGFMRLWMVQGQIYSHPNQPYSAFLFSSSLLAHSIRAGSTTEALHSSQHLPVLVTGHGLLPGCLTHHLQITHSNMSASAYTLCFTSDSSFSRAGTSLRLDAILSIRRIQMTRFSNFVDEPSVVSWACKDRCLHHCSRPSALVIVREGLQPQVHT